jgi:hypothetical protein
VNTHDFSPSPLTPDPQANNTQLNEMPFSESFLRHGMGRPHKRSNKDEIVQRNDRHSRECGNPVSGFPL